MGARRNDSALVCAQECNAPFPQKVHTAGYIHRGVDADSVRALSGRLSALSSVFHSKSVLYGPFVRARGALNGPKRRFPARADRRDPRALPPRLPGALLRRCVHETLTACPSLTLVACCDGSVSLVATSLCTLKVKFTGLTQNSQVDPVFLTENPCKSLKVDPDSGSAL